MTLSLGAEGISYLEPHEWEVNASYRFLHSERPFIGDEEHNELHARAGRIEVHSLDLSATYAITKLFSATLTLPFVFSTRSIIQDDNQRHEGSSAGLGDIRLVGNAWLLNPDTHALGNISLSLGLKAPSGDDQATDKFYTTNGTAISRPLDISAQPGDGGWGIVLEMQGFRQIVERTFFYVSGFYLINPQEKNNTQRVFPSQSGTVNSIPDQYLGRLGVSYAIWPKKGILVSLGGRIDGVPTRDLVGGSEGFRRPGFAVYVDPGISWGWRKNAFSLNTPVAVHRHEENSILDLRNGTRGTGGFADFLIVASYSRRF